MSFWFNAVLRVDLNEIKIGGHTDVQDDVIITVNNQPEPASLI